MSEYFDPTSVKDSDTPFVIDPVTREITNKKNKKVTLIQGDHNSERFTFEIPRFIEGRDVAKCNSVQIHYINIGSNRQTSTGVYTVNDLNIYPFVNDILTCSWLISRNATKHEGRLNFMIRFAEIENETEVKYAWHTEVYEGIRIAENINADAAFEEEYVDVIAQWKYSVMNELYEYVNNTVENNVDVAQIGKNQENIAALEQDLAVQIARMDEFTQLGEGSTTGDAELADLRVSVDGKSYKNAGTAVREQIKGLQNQLVQGYVAVNEEPVYTFKTGNYAELTLPGNTEVMCNGNVYRLTDATTKFEFAPQSYTLFNILFNYETNVLSLQYFQTAIPENTVIIGMSYAMVLHLNIAAENIWKVNRIDGYNPIDINVWCNDVPTMEYASNHLTLNIPECFVNTGYVKYSIPATTIERDETSANALYNILYNRTTGEMVVDSRGASMRPGYQRIGIVHTGIGVYLNGSDAVFSNNNNLAIAPLILGNGNKYVEFDSVNKTITFPNDTLIQSNKTMSNTPRHYQLSTTKGNNVVSYTSLTTSAIVVYYDITTDLLHVTPYHQILQPTHIAVATFRTGCGQVSINAPYKWNGKPFNMTASEFGIEEYGVADFKTNFNVKSVNHRGFNKAAPENTLSAFKLSAKNGFEYVECDVSFTSDNVPVVLHDSTIDRTSNGIGNINALTFDEVRTYDFGSWFSADYAGEKIPSFEEFIALCRKLSLHPYIEIKSSASYTQEQINQLVSIVQRYGMTGKVTYISFNATYLEYVKNTDANARLGYVVNDITESVITTAQGLKTDTNELFVDAAAGGLTEELVYLCINAGLPLEVWTLNTASVINTLDPYVSGVTSDNVHAGKTLFKANL